MLESRNQEKQRSTLLKKKENENLFDRVISRICAEQINFFTGEGCCSVLNWMNLIDSETDGNQFLEEELVLREGSVSWWKGSRCERKIGATNELTYIYVHIYVCIRAGMADWSAEKETVSTRGNRSTGVMRS